MQILTEAWMAWSCAWGLHADVAGENGCSPATAACAPEPEWVCLGATEGHAAWAAWPAGFERDLARRLFDAEDASTPVVRAVVAECGADFRRRMAAALALSEGMVPGPTSVHAAAWSGSVVAQLGCVQVFATAAVLESLLGRKRTIVGSEAVACQAHLVPIARALAHRDVELDVTLAGCEIDWATLEAIRPGDVLPTEHALSVPAQVCERGGERVFSAHLVRRGHLRAVELSATHCTNTKEGGP